MISCNLKGGLGNQMFQIAATVSLSIENNDNFGFQFDKCSTSYQGFAAPKYQKNFFRNIPSIGDYNFKKFYVEQKFSYVEIPYEKDLLLDGYFQSEKYFEKNKLFIKNLFYIDENLKKLVTDKFNFDLSEVTTVHIRRGDYLNNPNFHTVCEPDYYNKAINYIGEGKFVFISDDIEWVKQNFKSNNFFYSDLGDDILDFMLLTLSKNNIISNSTFSWWGAYLNSNLITNVIAPKKWFGFLGPQDTEDLYPNKWIVL